MAPYTNYDLSMDYYDLMVKRNHCFSRISREPYRVKAEKIAAYPKDISAYYFKHGTLAGLPSHHILGEKTKPTLEEILAKVKTGKYKRSKPRNLRVEYPVESREQSGRV